MRKAFEGKHYGFVYGIMSPKTFGEGTPEEWNERADALQIEKIAKQISELKPDYAMTTLGQNSAFYCSPNSVFDRVLGPGHCSRRDIPLEFAKEYAKYGIDFMLYTTSMAPDRHIPTVQKLRAVPPWYGFPYSSYKCDTVQDSKLSYFQNIWNAVHAEWAQRLGKLLYGWWVDGCYFADKLYDHEDEPNGHTFAKALRSGNPDALITMNPGMVKPRRNYAGSEEDYTAGEMPAPDIYLCTEKFVDGLRYHVLTYAWALEEGNPLKLRYSAEKMVAVTRLITDNGGVLTWDLPAAPDGLSDENFAELKRFAELYRESFKTAPVFRIIPVESTLEAEGSLEVITEKPEQIHAEFAGKTFDFQSPGKIALPKASGKQLLRVTLGNVTKETNLFCGRVQYRFPVVKKSECSVWQITREGEKLHFHAKVQENAEPVSVKEFWNSSGAEVFIKEEGDVASQYFASATDGKLFRCVSGIATDYLPDAKVVRTAEGYTMDFDLPCPHGKTCLVEIEEHVSVKDGLKTTCLFGGPGSGYQRFEYYGQLHLES